MSHTYASIADYKTWLTGPDAGEGDDTLLLKLLASASRSVDRFCERSRFGSGFGPRVGVNHYTGEGSKELWLDDDLIAATSLAVATSLTATPASYVETTDYYPVPFDRTPKRRLDARADRVLYFPNVQRSSALGGTFGYSDVTVPLSATASAIGTTSTTSVTVSAGAEFSPGMTILIGTEQLYVSAVDTATLTVVRGANGTTAAAHGAAAAIAKYVYLDEVGEGTCRLVQRRFKTRDAGADGTFVMDGGALPGFRESERTMLFAVVGHLRCVTADNGHLVEVGSFGG